MNYVPLISVTVVAAAVWAYTYSLGGPAARAALTLGMREGPTSYGYRPGSASWAHARMLARNPDHIVRDPGATFADLIDAPPAPRPPRFSRRPSHVPILMAVPDGATDADVARLTAVMRAVGVAHAAGPVLDAAGTVAVQHAVPLDVADSYDQLADMTPTGEYVSGWDGFLPRLLGTLNGQASAIQLDGWGTGEWRASR